LPSLQTRALQTVLGYKIETKLRTFDSCNKPVGKEWAKRLSAILTRTQDPTSEIFIAGVRLTSQQTFAKKRKRSEGLTFDDLVSSRKKVQQQNIRLLNYVGVGEAKIVKVDEICTDRKIVLIIDATNQMRITAR